MNRPDCVRRDEPMARHCTFALGGPAEWFAEPADNGELSDCLAFAAAKSLPVRVLGGGSNLLVADSGVTGLVIKLSAAGGFGGIAVDETDPLVWRVGAAVPLPRLVAAASRAGVAGLTPLAGIPGTVGGAAAMNAGTAEASLGDFITEAEAVDATGRPVCLTAKELAFGYRTSAVREALATGFILRFREVAGAEELAAAARRVSERKAATQPVSFPSAGCVFRNPQGASAGMLLDAAGCKGLRVGGAEVSRVHANFIVNAGGAAARDVAALALRMREMVFDRCGVRLRPEIVTWGDEPLFRELSDWGDGDGKSG